MRRRRSSRGRLRDWQRQLADEKHHRPDRPPSRWAHPGSLVGRRRSPAAPLGQMPRPARRALVDPQRSRITRSFQCHPRGIIVVLVLTLACIATENTGRRRQALFPFVMLSHASLRLPADCHMALASERPIFVCQGRCRGLMWIRGIDPTVQALSERSRATWVTFGRG